MDLNVIILCGRLAAPPELIVSDPGNRVMRLLVTVRSRLPRRRIDVVPVTLWDPPDELVGLGLEPGANIWVSGALQRRFSEGPEGRRSKLEVIASHVAPHPEWVAKGPAG